MALDAYLQLAGEVQGEIRGSVDILAHNGLIAVHAIDHQTNAQLDSSGRPIGARRSQPLVLTIGHDRSWPNLWTAFLANERFSTFHLGLWTPTGAGTELLYYSLQMRGARISGMKLEMLDNKFTDTAAFQERHKIAFVYDSITWVWEDGGLTYEAVWTP